jgi:hypothetical protein
MPHDRVPPRDHLRAAMHMSPMWEMSIVPQQISFTRSRPDKTAHAPGPT